MSGIQRHYENSLDELLEKAENKVALIHVENTRRNTNGKNAWSNILKAKIASHLSNYQNFQRNTCNVENSTEYIIILKNTALIKIYNTMVVIF